MIQRPSTRPRSCCEKETGGEGRSKLLLVKRGDPKNPRFLELIADSRRSEEAASTASRV